MGRLLDEYIKKHDLADATTLALIGLGCITLLLDDVPIDIKARVEELEQDAHKTVDNAASILFSTRGRFKFTDCSGPLKGGYTLDPDSKDDK